MRPRWSLLDLISNPIIDARALKNDINNVKIIKDDSFNKNTISLILVIIIIFLKIIFIKDKIIKNIIILKKNTTLQKFTRTRFEESIIFLMDNLCRDKYQINVEIFCLINAFFFVLVYHELHELSYKIGELCCINAIDRIFHLMISLSIIFV